MKYLNLNEEIHLKINIHNLEDDSHSVEYYPKLDDYEKTIEINVAPEIEITD